MSSDDELSDLSSLSSLSPAPSDDELEDMAPAALGKGKGKGKKGQGIMGYFPKVTEMPPKEPSPPPRKRSPSPEHEYVLADNPDIAFIVMFRSRFSDAFPKSLSNFGPQDIERDVVQSIPGDRVEHFLCALLSLLLNRKQDVKPGHYGRAMEDAMSSHKNQWPSAWEGKNPLSGGKSFNTMGPTERLNLLRTLILWTLSSSETVKGLITKSYRQNRLEDDLNQPRSVQKWGSDADKRRYFLIEGQDDTFFRVYRESNPAATKRTWYSVAGSIEELKTLADRLETKDGGPMATSLARKIHLAMPRFEAGEDKRKRREYRQQQKERFKRPDPGFSLYEGRTRGKRIKYTYSDDEDVSLSDVGNRRSARNTGTNTPTDNGPITTSSGRHIRAPTRLNVATGESAPSSTKGDTPELESSTGRPRRAAAANHVSNGYTDAGPRSNCNQPYDSEEDQSEGEFGDDEEDADAKVEEESDEEDDYDEDEAMVDDDLDVPKSLVVKISVQPPTLRVALDQPGPNEEKYSVPTGQKETDAEISAANATAIDEKVTANEAPSAESKPEAPGLALATDEKLPDTSNGPATSLAFRGSPEKTIE